MPSTITIDGDRAAARRLIRLGVRALRLRAPLERAADYAERQITGIPERSGRLARSVGDGGDQYRDVDDAGFELGTNVRYGRFVFGGTKHMDARPPKVRKAPIARDAAAQIDRHLAT